MTTETKSNTKAGATAADVRAYGRENGYTVGNRGVLSAELIAEFNKGKRGSSRYIPGSKN